MSEDLFQKTQPVRKENIDWISLAPLLAGAIAAVLGYLFLNLQIVWFETWTGIFVASGSFVVSMALIVTNSWELNDLEFRIVEAQLSADTAVMEANEKLGEYRKITKIQL